MPKKKPAKKPKTHISFRLAPAELEPLDADRKALPGVPVARNTYAKHAVQQYPKLRARRDLSTEDARKLAKDFAVKFSQSPDAPDYLRKAADPDWQPHAWVIEAIVEASR